MSVSSKALALYHSLDRHRYAVAFMLNLIVFLGYLYASEYSTFYYDSRRYWVLGSGFYEGSYSDFALHRYSDALRGVTFPLVAAGLIQLSHLTGIGQIAVFKVFSAVHASLLCGVLVPRYADKVFGGLRVDLGRIVAFSALVFFFWHGYFNFPLTDFFSLSLLVLGLYFLHSATLVGALFSGVSLGLAINARPIYLGALAPAALVAVVYGRERFRASGFRGSARLVAALVGGFFIGSLPQIYVNAYHFETWSPLVQSQRKFEGRNILLDHFGYGLGTQRYESNIGRDFPKANVHFIDPRGRKIFVEEGIRRFDSLGHYLGVVLRNPVRMAILYANHLFNGLDIRFPTVYLLSVQESQYGLRFVNYSALFLAIMLLILALRRGSRPTLLQASIVATIAFPTLLAIPAPVETRYFLTLHALLYAWLAFNPGYGPAFAWTRKVGLLPVLTAYVLFVVLCALLSESVFATIDARHAGWAQMPDSATEVPPLPPQ